MASFDIHQLKEIIWIQTAFIGDIVLNVAACEWLRQRYPHLRQHLITTSVGAEALEGLSTFASITVFEKRKKSAWAAMRAVKTQILPQISGQHDRTVILQPHRSARSSLLARYLGFPTITYRETWLGFLATKRIDRNRSRHETERDAQLLEALGINLSEFKVPRPFMEPSSPSSSLSPMIQRESGLSYIGVATGSVWATKRWPREGYAELIDALLAQSPVRRVVLLGGKTEAEDAEFISQRIAPENRLRLINLVAKTSLSDLRAIYPILDLLVSNDSSPVQYASAFNVPTVAIFGPTVPEFGFGPLADHSRVVEKRLDCRPCSDHGPMKCPLGHFHCMRMIRPQEVLAACESTMQEIGA
jgi:heptosyltransferase-2